MHIGFTDILALGAFSLRDLHFRPGGLWIGILAVALLAVGGALLLYGRERRLGRAARVVLSICRVLALAVLVFVLLQPAVDVETTVPVRPDLLVLVDGSQSMEIRDTRKDAGDLAEAAVALGKVPAADAATQRALVQAGVSMQQSADALARGQVDKARAAQSEAEQVLREVADHSTAPLMRPETRERLAEMEQKQAALGRETEARAAGGEDLAAAATGQTELARDLEALRTRLRDVGAPLSEAMQEELATVSRLDLVRGIFTTPELNVFRQMGDGYAIRYFRFGGALDPVGGEGEGVVDRLVPETETAPATHLGTAIQRAVDGSAGRPIAGVVVISDGASNGGLDPLSVAARMKQHMVPLYTVGAGLPRPHDIYLRGLVVQDVVFTKDLVPVRVQIHSGGYEKRAVELTVSLDGLEAARKTVLLAGGAQLEELVLEADREAGMAELEVAVSPLPGESTVENNRLSQPIRIVDEKIKVLYVEGRPRWEYRYLRAILKRDPRLDVKFLMTEGDRDLARASDEHIARFPEEREEAFKYDLVILGDVNPSHFEPEQLDRIEELVREGGGSFLAIAGRQHMPGGYAGTPIEPLLPVRIGLGPWEEVERDVHPVLTFEGEQSTVMSLEPSEARSAALWANVKPLQGVPQLAGAKLGATVLAVLSDSATRLEPFPLIAWQRYGSGKSLFVGTDRLWRVRFKTGDKYHTRFWVQAIQFLTLSRLLGENKLVSFQTDQSQYGVGETVHLYASVLDELYEPVLGPAYIAYVQRLDNGGEEVPVTLEAIIGVPGLYQGAYTPDRDGRYRVSAADDELAPVGSAEFQVASQQRERMETTMHEDLLRKMAEMSGGRYLAIRDLPILPAILQTERSTVQIRREVTVWDRWFVPVLFLAFAAIEWGWRRKNDLA